MAALSGAVDIVSTTDERSRLKVRTRTAGAELDFVRSFVELLVGSCCKRDSVALFLEPRIDSGYPDLVQVVYSPGFVERWVPERDLLDDGDLKTLAYLADVGFTSAEAATTALGAPERRIVARMERLCCCGMARRTANGWRPAKRANYFGVKSITAFEAKMSAPGAVLRQALMNTRFASASCVLLASKSPTAATRSEFARFGIGLRAGSSFEELVRAEHRRLPNSYVTLKFNEWVGSQLIKGSIG